MARHAIRDEDLSELQTILPELAGALMPVLNDKLRSKLRRAYVILSTVRRDYEGPDVIAFLSELQSVPVN